MLMLGGAALIVAELHVAPGDAVAAQLNNAAATSKLADSRRL